MNEKELIMKILESHEDSNLESEQAREVIADKIMLIFEHDCNCNYITNEGGCTCGHWNN